MTADLISNDFSLLHATLYHSSPGKDVLLVREACNAYAICDGYGRMSIKELADRELLWDWSHVRDSSPEAIARAAAYVRRVLGDEGVERVRKLMTVAS